MEQVSKCRQSPLKGNNKRCTLEMFIGEVKQRDDTFSQINALHTLAGHIESFRSRREVKDDTFEGFFAFCKSDRDGLGVG